MFGPEIRGFGSYWKFIPYWKIKNGMVKYAKIHHILGRFCSKTNEVLFLEQNRPEIWLILVYFAIDFYALPIY
jgi:hypothetical protein